MKANELKPGTKVSITLFQDKVRGDKDAKKLETKIEEVTDEGVIVLQMPTFGGKLVSLPSDVRYEMIFSTDRGFQMSIGQVVRRYKKEGFYLMDMVLTSPLERFQRREYFRIECALPALCMFLTSYEEEMENLTEIENYLEEHGTEDFPAGFGSITNISGGGAHFISSLALKTGDYILLKVNFQESEEDDEDIAELICKILDASYDKEMERYSYRLKFMFTNPKFRERIIHFVFEEERRIRRKVQG